MADITPLIPFLCEPYRKEEVLAAARKLQPPFLLSEIVRETGLPRMIVQRVLSRLVKQGVLTRSKAMMATTGLLGGGRHTSPRGTVQRLLWLYSWAGAE